MDSKVDEVEGTREEEFLVSSYKQKFEDIQQVCQFDATILRNSTATFENPGMISARLSLA
jgi:hypothetical protein